MTEISVPPDRLRETLTRILFGTASRAGTHAHAFVCSLYFGYLHRKPDPWNYAASKYESEKYGRALAALDGRSYERALELGCSEGIFTKALAGSRQVGEIVAADISAKALERARVRCGDAANVRFEHRDVFSGGHDGTFDLVVCSEILYYAGNRIPDLAASVAASLTPGGRVLLVHPWPKARALHAPFVDLPALRKVSETVYDDSIRPYVVTLLERS